MKLKKIFLIISILMITKNISNMSKEISQSLPTMTALDFNKDAHLFFNYLPRELYEELKHYCHQQGFGPAVHNFLLNHALARDTQSMQITTQLLTCQSGTDFIYGVDDANAIFKWDRKNFKLTQGLFKCEKRVTCLVCYSQEHLLLVGLHDGSIKIFDLKSNMCIKRIKGHTQRIIGLIYDPQRKLLFSGSSDCTVRKWIYENNTCTAIYTHRHPFITISYDAASAQLFLITSNNVTAWDTKADTFIKVITHDFNRISAINTKLRQLFVSCEFYIKVWDIDTHQLIYKFPMVDGCISHLLVDDLRDRLIIYITDDNNRKKILLWDLINKKFIATISFPYYLFYTAIAFDQFQNILYYETKNGIEARSLQDSAIMDSLHKLPLILRINLNGFFAMVKQAISTHKILDLSCIKLYSELFLALPHALQEYLSAMLTIKLSV